MLDQFVFGGDARARRPGAGADMLEDMILDLGIERCGSFIAIAPRTISPLRITAAQGLKPSG